VGHFSIRRDSLSGADVQTIKQFPKLLARFEKGNSLRWHFDSDSSSWIAPDSRSSLARAEAAESADFNPVAGSQGTDDAVKDGADDDVGFLQRNPNGLVNRFGQFGSGQSGALPLHHEKSMLTLASAEPPPVSARVFTHWMWPTHAPYRAASTPAATFSTPPNSWQKLALFQF
jgi:hypothetical protein